MNLDGKKRFFVAYERRMEREFTTTTAMVTHLLEARESRTPARSQKQLERLDLLILDEPGYVPFSKAGAELLFEAAGPTNARAWW